MATASTSMCGKGFLDRALDATNSFPGTWLASGLNLVIRINSFWHLRVHLSKSLVMMSGTRSLWSVCRVNLGRPTRYLSNFSHAYVLAGAFFFQFVCTSSPLLWECLSSRPLASVSHHTVEGGLHVDHRNLHQQLLLWACQISRSMMEALSVSL